MFNNISKTGVFFLGVLAGVAVIALMKSKTVQKGCAKIVAAGKQSKTRLSHSWRPSRRTPRIWRRK
ncbi:MAG: hypothetical protein IIT37_02020 [Bacteroidales bacterium]|nr:hypothetical protein [Bacteroidales bacterium]